MISYIYETQVMATLVPVLLAGEFRRSQKFSKQFVDISSEFLFYSHLKSYPACSWIIITGEEHRFLVAQQAQERIGPILLEPSARNTAPAMQSRHLKH